MLSILIFSNLILLVQYAEASLDYFKSPDFEVAPQIWTNPLLENTSLNLGMALGCNFCGDVFYHEPPPEDILFIPPPPMHPSYQSSFGDVMSSSGKQTNDQCNYCNLFFSDEEQLIDGSNKDAGSKLMAILIAFSSISAILCLYLIGTKRSKIISMTRVTLFKSTGPQPPIARNNQDKASSLNVSITNAGTHLSDPCYLQTNSDKNLTSPIISDHAPHKKTSIPSKYWSQPGSIIGRTMRRIPNEYEVPSSRTNSTGTSSAVYADMNNENNQRFFSPYNLHTYAEVREILDEHFHTSSNSSAMLSESNYDNGAHQQHGNCVMNGNGIITTAPNGSVQMSDFNSMRPVQTINYGQASQMNHHPHQINTHHNTSQHQLYEQPPQRAQVIITSNNQGVNPTLLNYKGRIHNVI